MAEFLKGFFDGILKLILSIQWYDIADIILVAFLFYYCIKLLRQTRAFNLIKGVIFVGLVYLVVSVFNMSASTFLFNNLFSDIVLVMILVFQPEIRKTIEAFGRGDIRKLNLFSSRSDYSNEESRKAASAIAKAAVNMGEKKIGALIVLEGRTPLGEIASTGSKIEGAVTVPLLENIFFPKAPLHDGAVVIKANRVSAAGCILPLTQNEMSVEFGTRHRAALGISEISDALVIVVSEETGIVSVAQNGALERDVKVGELTEMLTAYLVTDENEKPKVLRFPRRKK